jgi:tetratricopeptide (TPR) repeat protein/transcriptional regulator with XRE-family HTH domain
LTQEALAEKAHLSARTVSDLERGLSHAPRRDSLALLLEALPLSAQERAELEATARKRILAAAATAVSPSARPAAVSSPRGDGSQIPPLIARDQELALLERYLAGEGPPVLILAGEPGIGKSRLLREAASRAVRAGWTVLSGGCQRHGGQEPYAPILQALEHYIACLAPAHLRSNLQGCSWLARLLPELMGISGEELPAGPLAPQQERRLMFGAVARFLQNVAGAAGTLLVLDDLQWAGSDALNLLATLVRTPVEAPLRVIGAYRETEVQPTHALSTLLADLAHASLAAHRRLAPLSETDMGCLLDALLGGLGEQGQALRQRLLQRAGGVPFFAVSCSHALRAADADERTLDVVPWDVVQSVRQRVAALPEAAQAVLGVAAVVGRVVPPAILIAVVALPQGEVLAALDAAGRARLLVEDGQSYRFAHDVIREVVEADLGVARRMALHRQVAEALEQRSATTPVPVAVLAYHFAHSDAPEKAPIYLERAGDEALAQYAYTAAEGAYLALVEHLDGARRPLEAARVREKLATIRHRTGRYDAALEALEQAADAYGAARELDALGRVAGRIGMVHADHGVPTAALERLESLLAPLEAQGAHRGLAAVCLALANAFGHAGRCSELCAMAERAVALARMLGDDRLLAEAQMMRGFALRAVGRIGEALLANEEAIQFAEEAGDHLTLYWALGLAGVLYVDRGEQERGQGYVERATALAERLGDPVLRLTSTCLRGGRAYERGDWDQARGEFARALDASRQIGPSWTRSAVLLSLGFLSQLEGSPQEAAEYLAEAATIVERSGSAAAWHSMQKVLAYRDLLVGCPAAAHARLSELGMGANREQDRWFGPGCLALRAWALVEVGEGEQAGEVAAAAVEQARAETLRVPLTDALWIQALVATRLQRWHEAERALQEGLALARGIPYPYGEANLLRAYGEMHARRGDPEQGRAQLYEALAIFRRLGARAMAEQVEQAIAAVR